MSTSRSALPPETETKDDGDGNLNMDPLQETTDNSLERPQTSPLAGQAVAIFSDIRANTSPGQSLELNLDAHIIINGETTLFHCYLLSTQYSVPTHHCRWGSPCSK